MLQALNTGLSPSPELVLDDKKRTFITNGSMSIVSSLRPQCSWIQGLGAFIPSYLHFTMLQEIPMIVPVPKG